MTRCCWILVITWHPMHLLIRFIIVSFSLPGLSLRIYLCFSNIGQFLRICPIWPRSMHHRTIQFSQNLYVKYILYSPGIGFTQTLVPDSSGQHLCTELPVQSVSTRHSSTHELDGLVVLEGQPPTLSPFATENVITKMNTISFNM